LLIASENRILGQRLARRDEFRKGWVVVQARSLNAGEIVRARVRDSGAKIAWTQPVFVLHEREGTGR